MSLPLMRLSSDNSLGGNIWGGEYNTASGQQNFLLLPIKSERSEKLILTEITKE